MKKVVKKIIGIVLIIVGLFALFTPFTPGSWLALIGLELLGLIGVRMLIERALLLKGKRRQRLIQRLKKTKFDYFARYLEKRTPPSDKKQQQ
ncbi:hypothetical protein ACFL1G_09530 [Planctomycetota bacterium]